ncbi:MAG: fumarylacetoacetate hydrolase family protein [Variovorax sp.]|nr:fumarylacetoacetate hydrolase family protein [Variovorax sp.]
MDAIAQALAGARRSGTQLPMAPWLGRLPDATAAYAVQARVAALMDWFGPAGPLHWKSGGPSRDATLTHAPLPPDGVRQAHAGGTVDLRGMHFARPLIEAEIALRLARDLTRAEVEAWQRGRGESSPDPRPLLDGMAVSVEVVDSRWCLPPGGAEPADLARLHLADQQVHGALVLGDWVPFEARDWHAQTCTLQIADEPERAFRGSHPLGSPTWLLPQWLAHLTREQGVVHAGTIVTTGTWSGALPIAAGDRVQVGFEGIGTLILQL